MSDNLTIFGNVYEGVNTLTFTDTSSQQKVYINTADADATATDILSGKTAYINNTKVTGTIAFKPAQTYTPGTINQTISAGYFLSGDQTIAGDANLVAENIAQGVSIFGVEGTHSGGDTSAENELIERTISGVYTNGTVSKIGAYAFCMCNNLSDVRFENCTYIASSAFMWASIATADFPKCISIDSGAFAYCYSLKNISFPLCTNIGYTAFSNCNNLMSAIFPECTFLAAGAFQGCSKLTSVNFPKCSQINSSVFMYCNSLGTAVFASCNAIKNWAFSGCERLLSLYLTSTGYAYLGNSNTFKGTPIAGSTTQTSGVYGSIYVRASMLESYKTSGAWSYFSSRFVGLTDVEIEALDI